MLSACGAATPLAMLSVVIPTLNSAQELPATLSAVIPGVVGGLVRDVVIADGGSEDGTEAIADATGAVFVRAAAGRGTQLGEGARWARGTWLLFLHADTVLQPGWDHEVANFISDSQRNTNHRRAAAFRFALDDKGLRPRVLEALVGVRCATLRLPYGDQGLLISRAHYEACGGFRDLPLMEDVELVSRIGRGQITMLQSKAVTSAVRFRRDGYVFRSARNLLCLTLYYLRVPPRVLARLYG